MLPQSAYYPPTPNKLAICHKTQSIFKTYYGSLEHDLWRLQSNWLVPHFALSFLWALRLCLKSFAIHGLDGEGFLSFGPATCYGHWVRNWLESGGMSEPRPHAQRHQTRELSLQRQRRNNSAGQLFHSCGQQTELVIVDHLCIDSTLEIQSFASCWTSEGQRLPMKHQRRSGGF